VSDDIFETATSSRLPFPHWLALHHDPSSRFWEIAHLVLSGGPESMWAGRFDLTPEIIAGDVKLLYASGNPAVTSDHMEQCAAAMAEYHDNAPTVAQMVRMRAGAEKDFGADESPQGAAGRVRSAMRESFTSRGLTVSSGIDEPVSEADGSDVAEFTGPSLVLRTKCRHVSAKTGVMCRSIVPAGSDLCTRHGGRIYTVEELANIHRATREKIVAASEAAVDTLVDLLNSPNDMVRLRASEAVLNRAGLPEGVEITVVSSTSGGSTPSQLVAEKLERLAEGTRAIRSPASEFDDDSSPASQPGRSSDSDSDPDSDVVDAEVVEDGR
jgi:hypothetical protein